MKVIGLTPAERRVSTRAAAGVVNEQIARELGVSVKTVEAHLWRVFRKLGVRSRAQLAERIGADRPLGPDTAANEPPSPLNGWSTRADDLAQEGEGSSSPAE